MASVKGVNFTNITSTPVVNTASKEAYGKLRVTFDEYEASSLASGSDISVARLPKGATVYEVIVHHDGLGASSTIKVGDSADDDRYIAATSTASAGKLVMSEDGAIDGFGFEQTAETDIILTTGGAAISGTIKVAIMYAVE